VGFHHHLRPRRASAQVTAAVQFADVFVRARGVGWSGDPYLPPLQAEVAATLKLDELDLPAFIETFDEEMLKASVFLELAQAPGPGDRGGES
jgi:hypothetical protein